MIKVNQTFQDQGNIVCMGKLVLLENHTFRSGEYHSKLPIIISEEDIVEVGDRFYGPSTNEILFASQEMLSWNSDTTQTHGEFAKLNIIKPSDRQYTIRFIDLPHIPIK